MSDVGPVVSGAVLGERAIEGFPNPALGINPNLNAFTGEHVIPPNPYDLNALPSGVGLGGGIIGSTMDTIVQTTIDKIFEHIRHDAAFTRNFIEDVGNGTFLSPANGLDYAKGLKTLNGLASVSPSHVTIGEKMAAMSATHNPAGAGQQQGH